MNLLYDKDLLDFGGVCLEGTKLVRYRVILSDGSAHILYPSGYEYLDEPGSGFYPISMNGNVDGCYYSTHNEPLTKTGWMRYYTNDGSYLKFETWAPGPYPTAVQNRFEKK